MRGCLEQLRCPIRAMIHGAVNRERTHLVAVDRQIARIFDVSLLVDALGFCPRQIADIVDGGRAAAPCRQCRLSDSVIRWAATITRVVHIAAFTDQDAVDYFAWRHDAPTSRKEQSARNIANISAILFPQQPLDRVRFIDSNGQPDNRQRRRNVRKQPQQRGPGCSNSADIRGGFDVIKIHDGAFISGCDTVNK